MAVTAAAQQLFKAGTLDSKDFSFIVMSHFVWLQRRRLSRSKAASNVRTFIKAVCRLLQCG
ncbi:hypothetical protein [Paucibacter sp. M5-1]|uniref:hypothetical protein n=1 Tax=Paucibacter sp. M5-1 TaxID=3015998 RepID=UPI0022B90052|nr:hypothetical protein [Paucibacter sp. M5-1]MCZ7883024.1 hypothetical protein [Paucibacter sp. M5-1]